MISNAKFLVEKEFNKILMVFPEGDKEAIMTLAKLNMIESWQDSINLLEMLRKPEYTTFIINSNEIDGYELIHTYKTLITEIQHEQ